VPPRRFPPPWTVEETDSESDRCQNPGARGAGSDDKIKAALMHMAQVWLRLAANQTKEIEKDEAN
jgi:hypothetical protein